MDGAVVEGQLLRHLVHDRSHHSGRQGPAHRVAVLVLSCIAPTLAYGNIGWVMCSCEVLYLVQHPQIDGKPTLQGHSTAAGRGLSATPDHMAADRLWLAWSERLSNRALSL